ncbi:MAG: hypothetical protein JF588_08090 [Caulobacterales bacterium]|nr:hypothetical protein [Caulobacterales bacterium]
MRDFVDLQGASGARYRFRIWPDGAPHLPMGGNYVFVREDPVGFTVLEVGETNDLSKVQAERPKAAKRGATHVFTRLNVSRAIRTAEHNDLAAHYQTARVNESVR